MRLIVAVVSPLTTFIASCMALFTISPILDRLPVGKAYFADTPIHGLTYGELFATVSIATLFGFCIGLLHGLVCGKGYVRLIYIAALIPIVLMWIGFSAVTMGMGLIAFPIVVAYGVAVAKGVGKGENLRNKYWTRTEQ